VSPILRGRSWLEPGEREAAARVLCREGPVVWRVAVHGGCLYRAGEAGRGRVDFRGGAEYPQGGETSLILKEEVEWWEAGLYGQYV